jgi:hypothetical protein
VHGLELPNDEASMNAGEPPAPSPPEPVGGAQALLGPQPLYIRVWRVAKSNEAGRTIVENILFEDYVKGVVPSEWFPSWDQESLKAGCVAARTYGWYKILHPRYPDIGADVSDTTSTQVYKDSRVASTNQAADATRGQVVTYNGTPINAEYSAENSDPTTAGPFPYQPSVADPVCAGQPLNGHGRGLCQWGSQRWAIGAAGSGGRKTYDWILNHYYGSATLLQTAGQGLAVGDCAAVEGGTATVQASPNGARVDSLLPGSIVHILEGPTKIGSVNWWRIEWPLPAPTRSDGWVSDALLVETDCPARAVPIVNVQTSEITSTGATITWRTLVDATSVVRYGLSATTLTSGATGASGTDHTVTLSGLTPGKTYYYQVESAAAGYTTTTSSTQSFATPVAAPTIVISSFGPQTLHGTSADVFWETNAPSDTTIAYGTAPDALTQTATGLSNTVYHSATLVNLQPDTTYYVRAESAATGYVTGVSDVLSLQTLKALVFSNVQVTGLTKDAATLTWTLNAPAHVDVTYGAQSGALDGWQPVGDGDSSAELTGLTPNTTYYYVLSASADDYESGQTAELSFHTPPDGLPGDVDNDGTVTPADAATALRLTAGMESHDAASVARADVNNDGAVTLEDVAAILADANQG